MDWFDGFLIMLVALFILGLGFALGTDSVVNSCRNFNAFTVGEKAFICKENGESK